MHERTTHLLVTGFFLVFASYGGLLFAQTGQHPFQQKFRWNRYSVSTTEPSVLRAIEQIQAAPVEEYGQLYAKRRRMFRPTPPRSEPTAMQ